MDALLGFLVLNPPAASHVVVEAELLQSGRHAIINVRCVSAPHMPLRTMVLFGFVPAHDWL